MEYRRKCNVCGKIWCYNDQDLSTNKAAKVSSSLSAIAGIGGALSGNLLTMHITGSAMNNAPKPVDYERCPECNSSDTTLLEDRSFANEITTQVKEISYLSTKIAFGEKHAQNFYKRQSDDTTYNMAKLIEAEFADDEVPLFCVGSNIIYANEPIDPKTLRCCVFTNKKRAWYCVGKMIKLSVNNTVGCVKFDAIPSVKTEDEGVRKLPSGKFNFYKITVSDECNNEMVFIGAQEVIDIIKNGLEKVLEIWREENTTNLEQKSTNELPTANTSVSFSVADEIKKFKELLDLGILTQEEFDAKKKQLLGL